MSGDTGVAHITRIDEQGLRAVDMERLRPFIRQSDEFYQPPGRQHYRLLAYLASCVNSTTIFDIGTHFGDSAIALSYNESNVVESFDVRDELPPLRRERENVNFHQEDILTEAGREKWKARLMLSSIIFLDVDPHDGEREFGFLSWLRACGYRGLIVLDDIWYFKGMRDKLWANLESSNKRDVTSIGHWSGTGLVSFATVPPWGAGSSASDTDNWTLVTGYFDLTHKEDANQEIRERPATHYLEDHAAGTLAREQNLIVFCEPDYKERILAMRPKWLHKRTRVITTSFEDFPLTKYRRQVIASRGGNACARDPRNTASYYLFCMARFAMLKRAIQENPFRSTRFAWINICIERMGFQNLSRLDEALAQQREKFSTCHIDYVSPHTLSSLPDFFGKDGCRDPSGTCGRCVMCSGFFTGSNTYMAQVCERMEEKFKTCLVAGYGHADEQLLALVHADAPELFDLYVGDYQEMITNYAHVHERPDKPLFNLIRHSMDAGDWSTCSWAAERVWVSYAAGYCVLSDPDLTFLLAARKTCAAQLRR